MQQQAQDVATSVTATAAGAGWVSHLAGINEILTAVATLIAITTGAWVLYDKWQAKRKERDANGESSETNQ